MEVDFVVSWEDMAYGKGPHISPQFFREFLQPQYTKVTNMLRSNGIDMVFVDSDGNIEPLINSLLESGVNGILPLEAGAGMDVVALREKYGKSLRMIGNIDKKALLEGPEAIKKEVESKLTTLVGQGGYIPSIDHEVPAGVTLSNYSYYVDLLKRICSRL